MTKQLEDTFGLPPMPEGDAAKLSQDLQVLDEIDKQVPAITDLSTSDKEMDELATKANNAFDDLMSLGMNVEQRFAAPIFEAAAKMLGHAVMAKTAKLDKKLKAIDLELKRQRMASQGQINKEEDTVEGSARVLDRNELLRIVRGQQ